MVGNIRRFSYQKDLQDHGRNFSLELVFLVTNDFLYRWQRMSPKRERERESKTQTIKLIWNTHWWSISLFFITVFFTTAVIEGDTSVFTTNFYLIFNIFLMFLLNNTNMEIIKRTQWYGIWTGTTTKIR